ncbi:MAG: lamin tail domain-containing protein [Thermoplasmatales archaeon]|nr:lamin tail domain-containing protein [Thermoplasmatales archaeon]
MRRDKKGISRIVEFVIMFTVFIVIVTAFYSLANIWLRPPIVDYAQEEAMRVSEVLINNPGYMDDGGTDWEEYNATKINSNLKSLGFAVDNTSYGVLSMKKITAMRNLTYEKAKRAMALEHLNFNITFRYFNGSIMLSNKTDNKTTLTFGANFGYNATVSWKRIVNIVDLDGKYENATLTVYLSKKGRFEERVVINEIMYHPPSPMVYTRNEWVELYNVANMAVDVDKWTIEDLVEWERDTLMDCGNGTIIPSYSYAIIVADYNSVKENFTETLAIGESPKAIWLLAVGNYAAIGRGLNDTGDTITVRNRYYDVVDSIDYTLLVKSDDANGENETLEKKNSFKKNTDTDWESNWDVSQTSRTGGTPGRKNSIS